MSSVIGVPVKQGDARKQRGGLLLDRHFFPYNTVRYANCNFAFFDFYADIRQRDEESPALIASFNPAPGHSDTGAAGTGTLRRIHDLLMRAPPSSIALIDHDRTVHTYAELTILVDRMADLLRGHGVRAGDRVVVLGENCATFLAGVLALSRLDAWAALANARLTPPEVDRLMERAEARTALFTPEASPAAQAHAARMGATSIGKLRCGDIVVSPVREATPEPVEDGPQQTAVLIYTSGTVGEPKGVMLSHGNLLFVARTGAHMRHIGPHDTLLAVLPGTHIFGLSSVFLSALSGGARLICMPRFDARAVLRRIETGVTVLTAVPQMFANMLKVLKEERVDRPRHQLRYLYAGGSPLDLALKLEVERTFGLTLHNGYGQTEASPSIAATRIEDPRTDTAVGQPLAGVEIAIDSPNEQGVGEVRVRGPNVMKGYFRNPEATLATLTDDGFLKTGDLGRQDSDGAIHIVGRKKELIIHSGFNVYPPEVEAVLTAHAAVTLCAVVGRARNGNEEVVAFVTARAPVSEDELRLWARERLAPYKVPARVIVAEALPQAATGKILKNSLIEHFQAQLDERD